MAHVFRAALPRRLGYALGGMRWLLLPGLLAWLPVAFGGDTMAELQPSSSPDGRFELAVDRREDGGIVVREARSKAEVASLSGPAMEAHTLRLLWAPDAEAFAANFRAGERREATAIYRWDGKVFVALPSPEAELHARVVEPALARELEAAGLPADTGTKRLWDTWATVKWVDASTAEIHGESLVSYVAGAEPVDIAVGVKALVRLDPDGTMKVLECGEVPARD